MRIRQTIPRRVLRYTQEHNLLERGELLLVGVSGGPDSVCLLHVLAELREITGTRLHVAHLNHMLRGEESVSDAEYVLRISRELGLPATIEKRDVTAYRQEYRASLEEAARNVRYDFFSQVAQDLGAERVAVGHTLDDNVETILMNLLRGTGLAGLRGIRTTGRWKPGKSRLIVIRPLLEITSAETDAYCRDLGLSPRSDSTNIWQDRFRNQVRSRLIPLLQEYNPDIKSALLRAARTAGDALDLVEAEASEAWDRTVKEEPGRITIARREFFKLHVAVKHQLLRSAIERLVGDLRDIEAVHIEGLVQAMTMPAGKMNYLPRGLVFYSGYDEGLITTEEGLACPFPKLAGQHTLKVPGRTVLPGWEIRTAILEHCPPPGEEANNLKACFDFGATGRDLIVRRRRPGDRFQPLGMESMKKLQDFMVDARIPGAWRDRIPLVSSPEKIIWVTGWRIDHRARVLPSTRQVLCIEFRLTGTCP
ncbi:MAG: tRNA lysidine(34) synthetase TilS [Dehalococcoidia bacterium]|nr:tRNA lysidine(34) synthetase TilS [Dehalococcoidia bacterium]